MRLLLPVVVASLLAACVTSAGPFHPEPAVASQATLYIYRPFHFYAAGVRPDLWVDGVPSGDVASSAYLVRTLPPGPHTVRTKWGWAMGLDETRKLELEAGKSYYLRVSVKRGNNGWGLLGGIGGAVATDLMTRRGSSLEPVDEAVARKEIDGLRRQNAGWPDTASNP